MGMTGLGKLGGIDLATLQRMNVNINGGIGGVVRGSMPMAMSASSHPGSPTSRLNQMGKESNLHIDTSMGGVGYQLLNGYMYHDPSNPHAVIPMSPPGRWYIILGC